MPFFRKRPQRFRQQLELVHLQRRLARLGGETGAFHADEIAEIEQLEDFHRFGAEFLRLHINLHPPARVLEINEMALAHVAMRTDATRDAKTCPFGKFLTNAARYRPRFRRRHRKVRLPSLSKAANFSRRNASNSLSVCSMPASDSKQNQSNEQIEWGSASILPEGLASKQTDIYRDKFGWKGKKDGEIFLAPGIFCPEFEKHAGRVTRNDF